MATPSPPPPKPSGHAERVVHLDAVEEALRKPVRRTRNRPRRQLRDFAVRQLRRAEKYQNALDKQMALAKKGTALDPVLVQAVQTAKSITDTMMNAIEQIRRSDKAEREKMGGLTDDQLLQVLITQLARVAGSMTDDQWRLLIGVKFGEAVADALLGPREVAA